MGEPALDLSEIMDLYKVDARVMVDKMRAALTHWEDVAKGGPARQELRKLSHQLRGSGRTYGYPSVSHYSKAIEGIITRLDKVRLQADDRVREALRKHIEQLAVAFAD